MENEIYVLNPDYIFKNDVTRIYLYSKLDINREYSSEVKTFFHPAQAMIFTFFTHRRSLKENISLISNFFEYTEKDVLLMIEPFIENKVSLQLSFDGKKISVPKNFLINIKKISGQYFPLNLNVDSMKCKTIDIVSKRLNTSPRIITFMLTNRCVTKCCYCYADTQTKVAREVSTEKIINIIREAKQLKMYNINLIGGEVFLHEDWDLILKEIISNGFSPDVISTKVPITKEIMSKLKATGFSKKIQLSIDSIDAEILCETLKVNSNYTEKIQEGISILEDNNFPYQIETVLTKLTATKENIKNLHDYLCTLKYVTQWEIRVAMYSNYKNSQHFIDIRSDRKELEYLYQYIEQVTKKDTPFIIVCPNTVLDRKYYEAQRGSSSFKGARCTALNEHMFILPDGKVTICEQLYWNKNFIIGDINNASIEEIWNSSRALSLANIKQNEISNNSKCKLCKLFEVCFNIDRNRCWSDVVKAYGTEHWDYPDPRCCYAPIMRNSVAY
nr:radical SAM protein [uncultured Bacteroides sp.]